MIEAQLRKAMRCVKQGEFDAARQLYQNIIQRYPKNQAALQGLRALQQQINEANSPPPEYIDTLNALYNQGQYQAALQQGLALVKDYPKSATLHNMLGGLQASLGQAEQAAAHYQQAIALDPNNANAYNNYGALLNEQKHYDKALECYTRALQLNPRHATAYNNLGNTYNKLGQLDKAMANYHKALQLNPNYVEAHVCMGVALNELGQYREAITCQHRALELKSDFAPAYTNLAISHKYLGNYNEALANFARAITHQPHDTTAHFNYAYTLLLTGDFTNGWREYEWRPSGSKNGVEARDFAQPLWLGDSDISGKTILIHSEQGLGDAMHFSRYVKMVADLGARVIFEVRPQLAPVFESFKDYAQVVVKEQTALPDFDIHCPLLSLPLAFATRIDTIPNHTGYLHVAPAKIKHWQSRLGERTKPRIGLVWRGNPKHGEVHRRSLPLAMVLQHLPPDYDYISLQHEVADEDRPLLSQINHIGEDFTDFADTAAVCTQLDVLLSVDTSTAHLGGALGMPTWVILPYSPEFRWLLDRSDSPWYPTMRLFRQPQIDDWPGLLTAVAQALSERRYD